MDLKMEVYTPSLELIGILSIFRSVMWEEKAFTCGTFSIESILSEESISLLQPENIVWIGEETAGIIEHIQSIVDDNGPYITAKGRLLSGLLDRRILWGKYNMFGEPPAIMYDIVNDCAISPTRGDVSYRIIPNLFLDGDPPQMPIVYSSIVGKALVGVATVGYSQEDTNIRKQKTGGTLLEALEELGASNQVSFGIRFDASVPRMLFWSRPGVNRTVLQRKTEPIFFSTELDDVLHSEYYYDSTEYRTVSLVAGEREGTDHISVTVTNDNIGISAGIFRREFYVDARDLQSEETDTGSTMTETEYEEVLKNRGKEKLAKTQLVRSFSATVRTVGATYSYGEDFFLGDTITVTDDRLGISVSAVVMAVTRAISEQGETLELTLGYNQPTVFEVLKRKAEK